MQRPLLLAIEQSSTLLDLREHAGRAMSNGFDGIEWRLPAGSVPLQPAISHLDTIHLGALAICCEKMDIASAVQFVTSQLQAAESLAASMLNLSIPPVRLRNDDEGFVRYQDALNFAYELLHEVRFEAEARGVTVALEAATDDCLLSPIELRELIDAVNSPAIGVCLDLKRIGAIGSPLDWIHTLHRRVQSVRYSDVPSSGGSGCPIALAVGKSNRLNGTDSSPPGLKPWATHQTSQVQFDKLIQALDAISLVCPLSLFDHSVDNGFAGKRLDG